MPPNANDETPVADFRSGHQTSGETATIQRYTGPTYEFMREERPKPCPSTTSKSIRRSKRTAKYATRSVMKWMQNEMEQKRYGRKMEVREEIVETVQDKRGREAVSSVVE